MDLTKTYYKIAEVAEFLDIPQTTLRYWESEFPEVKPMRTATNRRYYTPADIETLQIIRFLLKDRGMKIEAAKEQLHSNRHNVTRRIQLIETLHDVKGDLHSILASLEKRR